MSLPDFTENYLFIYFVFDSHGRNPNHPLEVFAFRDARGFEKWRGLKNIYLFCFHGRPCVAISDRSMNCGKFNYF